MRTFLQDLRYGLRLLPRQPGFSLVATLVIALGIGANTTMFSLVDMLALKPRMGDTERMVSLYSKDRSETGQFRAFSYPNFVDLRDERSLFSSITAHVPSLVGITEGDDTRRSFISLVTSDFFSAFGVSLALGRPFTLEEERPRADIPVTIVSHQAWQRMGGSADVLGKTVRINQRDFTIVGVPPAGFGGPMAMVVPELWLPTGVYESISNDFVRDGLDASLADRTHHNLFIAGRLRDGLSGDAAARALEAVSRRMEAAYPVENKDQTLLTAPISRLSLSTSPDPDGGVLGVMAVVLLSMSGVVLLIACLNLANMQLARGASRRQEFAIRAAIGGSRTRAVRQLLTEGLVLALPGAAGALLLSWAAMRLLDVSLVGRLPIQMALQAAPDWRVLAATIGFAVLATVFFGLGPALSLVRADLVPALKQSAGELPARRSRWAARHLLVMGQLALSLALLTAGGLFMRGASVAAELNPGFTFDRGILAQVDASLAGYTKAQGIDLYSRAVERLRALPGVEQVGIGSLMPFGEFTDSSPVQRPGPRLRRGDPAAADRLANAVSYAITPDFFSALGLTLVRGRDFTAAEAFSGGRPVAIIDQALARQMFGDEDPVGRELQVNGSEDAAPVLVEVVGLAPPILHQMNDSSPGPQIYRPLAQDYRSGVTMHLRTRLPEGAAEAGLLPAVRQALRDVDPRLPVVTLETRPMFRDRNLMLWVVRAGAWVFSAFGLVALAMAALGVYGVKAYLVSRRTREIGIRMALGATSRDVVRLVIADGMVLTAAGLAVGLVLSALVGRAVGSLLFQGSSFDPVVVASAFATLFAAAALASWLPARRAARIAPTRAIREL